MLMSCWYRPRKPGNLECIQAFREELLAHRVGAVGTLIVGDVNVHSKRWLMHSSGETLERTRLQEICQDEGLKQIVQDPTRKEYLLDLVMTDIPNSGRGWRKNPRSQVRANKIETTSTRNTTPAQTFGTTGKLIGSDSKMSFASTIGFSYKLMIQIQVRSSSRRYFEATA